MRVLRKYSTIYKSGIINLFTYRLDYLTGYLSQFIVFFVQITLWSAVSASSDEAIMTQLQVISYFSASLLINLLTPTTSDLAGLIKSGDLSLHIVRPYNVILNELTNIVSGKTAEIVKNIPFFIFILFIYSGSLNFSEANIMVLVFIPLGLIIAYLFSLMFNLLSFWFVDIGGFTHFLNTFQGLVNGRMIPYQFMPSIFLVVLNWLPFQFIVYYPIALLTGLADPNQILQQLFLAVGYCVLLGFICWFLYKKGLKRYTSVGG